MSSLTELDISSTPIRDLRPISLLNNLMVLDISRTQVDDLNPLAQLSNLATLYTSYSKIKDLDPLAQLSNLTTLSIFNTKVSDLSPIAQLDKLITLYVYNTEVTDISPLAQLSKLVELSIYNTQVSDIKPLTYLSKLAKLSIYNTQVDDLTPLAQLNNLIVIHIHTTKINDLSPLSQLSNLTELDVSNTKISDLTPLNQLGKLARLSASDTKVNDLSPLAQMYKLMDLSISNTQVSDLSPLVLLSKLTRLSVSNTQVSDLSPLAKLNKLTKLDVSNTQVSDLSPLKTLIYNHGIEVTNSDSAFSSGIYIKGCPLINPPFEIMEQGNEVIIRYWDQIEQQQGAVELYEAKLIIVGEGGTGKTTLFQKLIDPNHQVGNTPETHGINIYEGLPFQHPDIEENTFHANLWDFGGQDLQYMTHQFFLTPRALYVLMMDARRESPNLAYWFKIISLLGRESEDAKEKVRLLMVFNTRANSTGKPQYHDILKFYEDTIDTHFLEVDLAIDDYRFDNLKNTIQNHLVNLPIVKSQLPRLWKNVREDLRAEAKQVDYISTSRFAEICSNYQIKTEEDQWLLSGYLHLLGSLLHFQNDRGLRTWLIINPQWAVNGVYTFLSDEEIISMFGHFKESDFIQLLVSKGYNREGSDLILQMMTKNNFDICYEASPGRFVAAQLLPDIAPDYPWHSNHQVLRFRYQYSIMPKGLMSRLIVRLSDYLEMNPENGKQIVWKKGGVFSLNLREGECRVRLREDDAESKSGLRQILIDVIGDENARRYALYEIRKVVDDLHRKWFRSLKPDEMVPCCCSECRVSDTPQLYKLENLLKKSTKRRDTSCDYSGEDVLIQTLLEGIYDQKEIFSMKRER